MNKEIKKRKDLRLKGYDYSSLGAYFVTICTRERKKILSNIIKPSSVGVGAFDDPSTPRMQLTEIGKIIEKYLLSSEKIPGVKIDRYVIMPDHIHVIIFVYKDEYTARKEELSKAPNKGSSRAPTPTNQMIPHIVSTFKRFCNKEIGDNIFQRGYMEHIVRDREDYETRVRYIYENPICLYYNELCTEE